MIFGSCSLDLTLPRIMGVLNITPDSFSDGGQLFKDKEINLSSVLARAETMVQGGADFIDIGGESTRPGANPVSLQEEMDRVLPVVERLSCAFDVVISVDTSSPELMIEAHKLGAGLINDVRSLERDGALIAAAKTGLPVCLMHMKGSPETMQDNPQYSCVVDSVMSYLSERVKVCIKAGIKPEQIILDPGIGFGKTDEHNIELLRSCKKMGSLGCPVLIGVSRKSLVGRLLNRDIDQRLAGSLAFAYASLAAGAKILRVHDVAETADVLKVYAAMNPSTSSHF